MTNLETYLNKFDEADWLDVVERLLTEIHEVDRNAVQIWFRFYPLELYRYLRAADDEEKAIHGFAMLGYWELKDQIDSSHRFLYGHRYWKVVKAAIEAETTTFEDPTKQLAMEIRETAEMVAEK